MRNETRQNGHAAFGTTTGTNRPAPCNHHHHHHHTGGLAAVAHGRNVGPLRSHHAPVRPASCAPKPLGLRTKRFGALESLPEFLAVVVRGLERLQTPYRCKIVQRGNYHLDLRYDDDDDQAGQQQRLALTGVPPHGGTSLERLQWLERVARFVFGRDVVAAAAKGHPDRSSGVQLVCLSVPDKRRRTTTTTTTTLQRPLSTRRLHRGSDSSWLAMPPTTVSTGWCPCSVRGLLLFVQPPPPRDVCPLRPVELVAALPHHISKTLSEHVHGSALPLACGWVAAVPAPRGVRSASRTTAGVPPPARGAPCGGDGCGRTVGDRHGGGGRPSRCRCRCRHTPVAVSACRVPSWPRNGSTSAKTTTQRPRGRHGWHRSR